MKVDQEVRVNAVEAPRGIYPARVDEKGRLKLPAPFQSYLGSMGSKVFVTSLDVRTARIYPLSIWKENEALFEEAQDDPQAVEDLAFIANDLGCDAEMDAQGRVLIHPELRRALEMESQQVYIDCYRGRINVYGQALYEEKKRRALEGVQDKLKALEKKGLR